MAVPNGDNSYANCLVNRAELVNYVTKIIGSRADAEDIVQDAFIRLLPQSAISTRSPRSYLFKVVQNLATDLRRRRKIEARHVPEDLPFWIRPIQAETPEELALFRDELKRVSEYLDNCTQDIRTVVVMYRFGGHTMEQISKELDVSVATVHRILRKSLADISDLLDRSD